MDASLRALKCAIAVQRHRSFRRAAEVIGISQPALSVAVAGLESRLGIALFHRTSRQVTPTELGDAFLARVERLLDELDATLRECEDIRRLRGGRVVLTCLSSIAGRLMPAVIRTCALRHPGMEVVIRDDVATRTIEAVASGEVDLGVTVVPQVPRTMVGEVLLDDPFSLVVPRGHRFASQAAVAWRELEGEDLVVLATTSGSRSLIDGALAAAGVQVRRYIEVAQLATVHGMLECGLGISVLPQLALPIEGHPKLVSRPLERPRVGRRIRILRRKDRPISPTAEALLAVLRDTAAQCAGTLPSAGSAGPAL